VTRPRAGSSQKPEKKNALVLSRGAGIGKSKMIAAQSI
jgi:hypothetical protein